MSGIKYVHQVDNRRKHIKTRNGDRDILFTSAGDCTGVGARDGGGVGARDGALCSAGALCRVGARDRGGVTDGTTSGHDVGSTDGALCSAGLGAGTRYGDLFGGGGFSRGTPETEPRSPW